ncbi:TRAP-type C4-dicarboxylate transport system substrate-binding protein [Sulfitobacter undariae]|uniref:TRAP-type C4-dicarboxylate transport system substrate-binding protein n=1 Tax=Sulfitobacter undariae TaxID=1563671 RepID=A0A7W6E635_9RHOB|nr:C4-dicarboxylate TRAP transporter substrate-binding protein [Sulfitobacter undariae]MBB3994854.1 TRAP-type C4-dicarboxylate transport system substrate-binding protein [Sulfitobacter undariae]
MKLLKLTTLAAITAFTLAPAAQAETLRHAIGAAGDGGLMDGTNAWADYIKEKTDGETDVKVYAGSLLNFTETFTGLRDGIADSGFVVPAYHRAELPYANLLSDMGTAGVDPVAMAGAANEFMLTCASCLAEFNDAGQIFLGNTVTGPYYMYSQTPIKSLADFQGKKIRGFGPFGRWLDAMGATAVSLGSTDIYESMSQGHIDGNVHTLETLDLLSTGEVADYALNQPVAVFIGNSMFNVSQMTWGTLSDKAKRAMIDGAAFGHAIATVDSVRQAKDIIADSAPHGVEMLEPDADVKEKSEAFRSSDMENVVTLNRDTYNISDAPEQAERFQALVAKWEELVKTVDVSDPKAVGELYLREVFSKIDPASLG